MLNNPGVRGRGRARGKKNNNKYDGVHLLIDCLPQNVIRKRRTTTPNINLSVGRKGKVSDITDLEEELFKDVEEADDLPECFEHLLGPIPNTVGLHIDPLDVACQRSNMEKRSNNRLNNKGGKENQDITVLKEKETVNKFDPKLVITASDHLSVDSAHVVNNGAGSSSNQKIIESNSPQPTVSVLFDIPGPIPYNLKEIMFDFSLRRL